MRGYPLPLPEPSETFGDWTVVDANAPRDSGGARCMNCRCRCGSVRAIAVRDLRSGKSKRCRDCGNHTSAQRGVVKHGAMRGNRASPEYRSWKGMRERCTKPKHPSYPYYGALGIRVHPDWLGAGGFQRFLEHVGLRPSPKHSIDRIRNDRDYEPGNVRWATDAEQNRNKGDTRLITLCGKTQCLKDWARERGLRYDKVHARLRLGWSVERALELCDARIEVG